MKYHEELDGFNAGDPNRRDKGELQALNIEGDPAQEFNPEFLTLWQNTSNYTLFKRLTSDALLFSIVEPRHPCAGGLNIEDIQRRLTAQVAELHLDDRVREGREALNRHFATGQKKVSAAFNSFWGDIESMREAQRKRNEERASISQSQSQRSSLDRGSMTSPPPSSTDDTSSSPSWFGSRKTPALDITRAQASPSTGTVGQRAGAYISSWGSWASEKRREWQEKKTPASPSSPNNNNNNNITSPSTPTLGSITEETKESDRDRGRRSLGAGQRQRHSEDATDLSRSVSRRKRWSNIILKRDSGDNGPTSTGNGGSIEASEADAPPLRSPLSRETPVGGADTGDADSKGSSFEPVTHAEAEEADRAEKEAKGKKEDEFEEVELSSTSTDADTSRLGSSRQQENVSPSSSASDDNSKSRDPQP